MSHLEEKTITVTQGHDVEKGDEKHGERRRSSIADALGSDLNAVEGQLFSMNDVDPALDKKMRLVNNVSYSTIFLCANAYLHRLSIKSVGLIST